eukprot:TRINITY_DN57513_c0_g1_i1.p1 TRINITY_DN57513_c0_g1~~TRINITY_DN57513_c0_g1_i1.p1  ORF type:complete len:191 (-),score=31.65 TRINITY_DN57513_c0_g1_i1:72-644(-)
MFFLFLLFFSSFFFFFFQAEDGIRDAQESRGLGDVYKRQVEGFGCLFHAVQGLQEWGMSFHTVGFFTAFLVSVFSSISTFGLNLYRWEANEAEGPSQPASILSLSTPKLNKITTKQLRLAQVSLLLCSTSHVLAFISEDFAVCSSLSCHVVSLITWHKIAVAFWQPAQHALLSFAAVSYTHLTLPTKRIV